MVRTRDEVPMDKLPENKTNIGATVDLELWRRLRALAIRQGKRSGDLLDEAMKMYLDKMESNVK